MEVRGKPSKWLLKNSKGYPDFLFTILTYAMLLLVLVSLVWIAFAMLAYKYSGTPKVDGIITIMNSMKTGLISLAGVIFGLAGSYTVRRFKKDDHYVAKNRFELEKGKVLGSTIPSELSEIQLSVVQDEEDI